MRIFLRLLIIILVLLISSCDFVEVRGFYCYKALKPPRKLKLNGYYFSTDFPHENYYNEDWREIILYEDGTYFDSGRSLPGFKEVLDKLERQSSDTLPILFPSMWGAYSIRNDTIITQNFISVGDDLFFNIFCVNEVRGKIVNDSTIYIFEETFRGETKRRNYFFNFHQCNVRPNPDNWIKHHRRINRYWNNR